MPAQKMHWCSAKVNLAGQNFTIIWFDQHNPISWPEAQLLMLLHGEENVYEVKPLAFSNTTPNAEKERLQIKYTWKPVEQVFPGRTPRMEMMMPASEDMPLPHADGDGKILEVQPETSATSLDAPATNGNGEEPDEDEDDPAIDKSAPPPPQGPAIFKPGKYQPPRKGA